MPTLAATFLKTALDPLHFARVAIMGKGVEDGLKELAAEVLRGKLDEAVAKTASKAGLRKKDILALMPVQRFEALQVEIDRNQHLAIPAWHDQPVESRRSSKLALLSNEGQLRDLKTALVDLAQMGGQDAELYAPLTALSEAVSEWQSLILKFGDTLDDDSALKPARFRRALRRASVGLVLLAAGGVGVWMWWRVDQARKRISSSLSDSDVCATLTITPADLRRATVDQGKLIVMRKNECVKKRAREKRERLKKEKRAAYEKACTALADALSKNTAVSPVEGMSEAQADVAKRIATGKLHAKDLGPAVPELPCGDTPSKKAIDASFEKAVLASKHWLEHAKMSDRTRGILSDNVSKLDKELKKQLSEQAEKQAAKALMQRKPAQVARAQQLCALLKLLSLKRGAFCRNLPAP